MPPAKLKKISLYLAVIFKNLKIPGDHTYCQSILSILPAS